MPCTNFIFAISSKVEEISRDRSLYYSSSSSKRSGSKQEMHQNASHLKDAIFIIFLSNRFMSEKDQATLVRVTDYNLEASHLQASSLSLSFSDPKNSSAFSFFHNLKWLQFVFLKVFLHHSSFIEASRARFWYFLFKSRDIFGFIFQIKR